MPRVIERFGGKHGHLGRCLIFVPDEYHSVPPNMVPNLLEIAIPATKWARDFNCTIFEGHVPDDFYFYYPNGSYTGPLGMLQRSEFDSVPFVGRPDSLPFNPVLTGKVFTAADVAIGFRKKGPVQSERELTAFVTDFPGIVYVYVLIALFIFIVLFLIFEKKNQTLTKRLAPKNIAHLMEQVAYCLVDQMNLDAATNPGRLLLVSLHTLLLVFIYGLFLSKIGADLVVMKEPYNIQSVEDIIQPDSQTKPLIIRQLFLINLMKEAAVYRPDSTLARLLPIIMSDPKKNILNLDMSKVGNAITAFNGIFSQIMERESALLLPVEFFAWFRHFQCVINPSVMSKVQMAKETFAHGIVTFAYAPKIHPMVRKVMDYFTQCYLEMGIVTNRMLAHILVKDMLNILPDVRITSEVTQCQDITMKRTESGDEYPWRPFNSSDFIRVYEIMALFLTLAAIVLLIEWKWSQYEKKRRDKFHQRKSSKTIEVSETFQGNRWIRLRQETEKRNHYRRHLQVNRSLRMRPKSHYNGKHLNIKVFKRRVTSAQLLSCRTR